MFSTENITCILDIYCAVSAFLAEYLVVSLLSLFCKDMSEFVCYIAVLKYMFW